MINVGGSSYNDGIEFTATKYKVNFEAKQNEIKIFLRNNEYEKTTKVLDFIWKIPFIRGIVLLIRNVDKKILFGLILIYITNINFEVTKIEHENNFLVILLLTVMSVIIWKKIVKKILKNIKVTHQYHGAEHKVINTNYEEKEINLSNCKNAPRIADNCGTMLVTLWIFTIIITYAVFSVFKISGWGNIKLIISYSIAYELFLLKRDTPIICYLFKIGYWLQEHILTREPTEQQLNQAIEAFRLLEQAETGQISENEIQNLLKGVKSVNI